VVDAEADASPALSKGVVLSNVEGFSFVRARTFIDATATPFSPISAVRLVERLAGIRPASCRRPCFAISGVDWGIQRSMSNHVYLPQALADDHFSQLRSPSPAFPRLATKSAI